MGQYFYIVNLDKKQYLHPHRFKDGLKLLEFGCSSNGTLTGLTLLLRQSDGSGGGDYHGDHPIVGTWAGDRITIVGDYDSSSIYDDAQDSYQEISHDVIAAMYQDRWIADDLDKRGLNRADYI